MYDFSLNVNLCKYLRLMSKDTRKNADKNNVQFIKGYEMIKKAQKPSSNISDGVAFLLRGAKKRRSMAIASAKMINSDLGIMNKLVALK